MIPSETPGISPFGPENPPIFPPNSGLTQSNNLTSFQFSRFLTSLPNYQTSPQAQDFAPNPSGISSNSTSDEAEDHQVRMIDERKQRRMISNRESARRSRMRKQRRLDDLRSQVLLLRTENCKLMDSLKHELEGHQRVLQENVRLKEEVFDLRRMVTELHECNSYTSLKDL